MNEPLDLQSRRRRAVWRANHRGSKELDVLIGRYAEAHLADMAEAELARFEEFLALPDPELQKWLLSPAADSSADVANLVASVRRFHGLG